MTGLTQIKLHLVFFAGWALPATSLAALANALSQALKQGLSEVLQSVDISLQTSATAEVDALSCNPEAITIIIGHSFGLVTGLQSVEKAQTEQGLQQRSEQDDHACGPKSVSTKGMQPQRLAAIGLHGFYWLAGEDHPFTRHATLDAMLDRLRASGDPDEVVNRFIERGLARERGLKGGSAKELAQHKEHSIKIPVIEDHHDLVSSLERLIALPTHPPDLGLRIPIVNLASRRDRIVPAIRTETCFPAEQRAWLEDTDASYPWHHLGPVIDPEPYIPIIMPRLISIITTLSEQRFSDEG